MLWRLTTYLKYTWDSSSLLLEVLSYDSVDITQALPIFSQKLWIMSFIKYIFWKSNKILSLSNIDLWRKMPKDKFLERSSSGDVCMVSSIFICHLSLFFFFTNNYRANCDWMNWNAENMVLHVHVNNTSSLSVEHILSQSSSFPSV